MAWPFVKSALAPFRAPLDGSASSTRANQGEGICLPVAPPPGGPGQNTQPFPGAPATKDTAARAAPVITTWFDDNGMAQACFPGNFTALGVGSPGQVGPPGPPGPQGPQGNPGQAATVTVGNVSSTAPGGTPSITNSGSGVNAVLNFVLPQGNPGPAGAQGNNGNSVQVRGSVATASALPTSGMVIGDIWIAQDSGNGFEWNGSSWVNVGQMRGVPGPAGPVGPAGPSINLKGSVPTSADLPTTGNQPNDGWIATDTGDLWIWNGSTWENVGKITGPQGPAGPTGATGAQGANGASATITVGTVNTLPPGSPATVANVGTALAAIFNFGLPQGQTGATGNPGPTGATGPQGPAFTPATTGSGNVFALQTAPTITTPMITGGATVTGTLTTQSQTITGNVTQTGNVTVTGDDIVVGRRSIGGSAGTAAIPAAASAGTNFLGGGAACSGAVLVNAYYAGSTLSQMPTTGTAGANVGGAQFGSNSTEAYVTWAPPAADNAAISPAIAATFSPTQAVIPGGAVINQNRTVTSGPLALFMAQAHECWLQMQVDNVRAWTHKVEVSGVFAIADITAGADRLQIDTQANVMMWGQGQCVWSMPVSGNNTGYCGSPTIAWQQMNAYGYVTLSDPRDKRDMAPAPAGALEKVKAIPVINYRLKQPPAPKLDPNVKIAPELAFAADHYDQLRIGFNVTDVAKVQPDCVNADADGNPRGYSLSDINALLWQAVQELTAKVEALEAASGKVPIKEPPAPSEPEPEPTPQHRRRH